MKTEQLELIDFTNSKIAKLKKLEKIIDQNIHVKESIRAYNSVNNLNVKVEACLFTPVDKYNNVGNYVRLSIGATLTARLDNQLLEDLMEGKVSEYTTTNQYEFNNDDLIKFVNKCYEAIKEKNLLCADRNSIGEQQELVFA